MQVLGVPEEVIFPELKFPCLLHIFLSPTKAEMMGITKCLLRHLANEHKMLRSKTSFFNNTLRS